MRICLWENVPLLRFAKKLEKMGLEGKVIQVRVGQANIPYLELPNIRNEEFEITLGCFVQDYQERAIRNIRRCMDAIRYMDEILTEFKCRDGYIDLKIRLCFRYSSMNEAGETFITLKKGRNVPFEDQVKLDFIHELVHSIQFQHGLNITEEKEEMIEVACEYIPNSWIPSLFEKLTRKYDKCVEVRTRNSMNDPREAC